MMLGLAVLPTPGWALWAGTAQLGVCMRPVCAEGP